MVEFTRKLDSGLFIAFCWSGRRPRWRHARV